MDLNEDIDDDHDEKIKLLQRPDFTFSAYNKRAVLSLRTAIRSELSCLVQAIVSLREEQEKLSKSKGTATNKQAKSLKLEERHSALKEATIAWEKNNQLATEALNNKFLATITNETTTITNDDDDDGDKVVPESEGEQGGTESDSDHHNWPAAPLPPISASSTLQEDPPGSFTTRIPVDLLNDMHTISQTSNAHLFLTGSWWCSTYQQVRIPIRVKGAVHEWVMPTKRVFEMAWTIANSDSATAAYNKWLHSKQPCNFDTGQDVLLLQVRTFFDDEKVDVKVICTLLFCLQLLR
jgi:hypothetical protein